MISRLLAWLLWQANGDPHVVARQEFYALKERLLRRHGQHVGDDLQHIRKPCWGYRGEGCDDECRKCGGTGIFDEFWVLLQRWRMGRYTFHVPTGQRSWTPPLARPTIEGFIRHSDRDHGMAHEAALWLFLLYDPKTFWRLLRVTRLGSPRWLPLSRIQAVVFEVRMFIYRLKIQRCVGCGRWTVRWSNACVFSLQCRACEHAQRRRWAEGSAEPPF